MAVVIEKYDANKIMAELRELSHLMQDAADCIESLQSKLAKTQLERNAQEAYKNYYKDTLTALESFFEKPTSENEEEK